MATLKNILTSTSAGSQNKNKAKQWGSTSWLREGKVESQNEHIFFLSLSNNGGVCFLFLLEIPVLYAQEALRNWNIKQIMRTSKNVDIYQYIQLFELYSELS